MEIVYTKPTPSDAAALIEYMNTVGGQSDNLSFGGGEFKMPVEAEEKYINNVLSSPRVLYLLAKYEDKIIGEIGISPLPRRMSHVGELSITVLKKYWGQGIGTELMRRAIAFARENCYDVIKLEVRSDNERAINLYRRLGFEKTGDLPRLFKVNGEHFDVDQMMLIL